MSRSGGSHGRDWRSSIEADWERLLIELLVDIFAAEDEGDQIWQLIAALSDGDVEHLSDADRDVLTTYRALFDDVEG